jgi:hypothetical protein
MSKTLRSADRPASSVPSAVILALDRPLLSASSRVPQVSVRRSKNRRITLAPRQQFEIERIQAVFLRQSFASETQINGSLGTLADFQ